MQNETDSAFGGDEENKTRPIIKPFYTRWWFWAGLILLIVIIGGVVLLVTNNKNDSGSNNLTTEQLEPSDKTKFEIFPVRLKDFVNPAKMYGLWPYGVKGNNSSSHNEGHPGWDFELKKGSKIYAIGDLFIDQIHDGDVSSGDFTPQVIEASSMLGNQRFHIVYHSVTNLEPNVKKGENIKAGEILAEVGYPLSENSAMIHFGIFPPNDSVGACPTVYFSNALQPLISQIVANSVNVSTGQPFASACIGKISKNLYLQNYPDRANQLRGSEQWE